MPCWGFLTETQPNREKKIIIIKYRLIACVSMHDLASDLTYDACQITDIHQYIRIRLGTNMGRV